MSCVPLLRAGRRSPISTCWRRISSSTLSRHSSRPTLSRSSWPVAVVVPTGMPLMRRSSTGSMPNCVGQHVHVALDGKGRLRHAKAAERAAGRVVGVHGVAVDLGVGHDVGAGGVRGGARHHLLAQAGIGAAVAVQLGFDGRERAVAARAGLDADQRGVALGVEAQALLARVEHLDRAAGDRSRPARRGSARRCPPCRQSRRPSPCP